MQQDAETSALVRAHCSGPRQSRGKAVVRTMQKRRPTSNADRVEQMHLLTASVRHVPCSRDSEQPISTARLSVGASSRYACPREMCSLPRSARIRSATAVSPERCERYSRWIGAPLQLTVQSIQALCRRASPLRSCANTRSAMWCSTSTSAYILSADVARGDAICRSAAGGSANIPCREALPCWSIRQEQHVRSAKPLRGHAATAVRPACSEAWAAAQSAPHSKSRFSDILQDRSGC